MKTVVPIKSFKSFFADLVVVFVGVFLAFQLSDYKDERAVRQARVNYYESCKLELTRLGVSIKQIRDTLGGNVAYYEKEISKGNKPKLKFHRSIHFPSQAFVVKSAFNDNNFSTLGQEFIVSISLGSNFFEWIDVELRDYNERVRDLLYNREFDPNMFYDDQGRLREEYKWYIDDLKEINRLLDQFLSAIYDGAIPATDGLIEEM
jgi:hypothetical protein